MQKNDYVGRVEYWVICVLFGNDLMRM